MWIFWCLFKFSPRLKLFPHWLQKYGFSPVWTLLCFFRSPAWLKRLPHCMQPYGFSPVWHRWCILKLPTLLNVFPHTAQECKSSLPKCSIRIFLASNAALLAFANPCLLGVAWFEWTKTSPQGSALTCGLCVSAVMEREELQLKSTQPPYCSWRHGGSGVAQSVGCGSLSIQVEFLPSEVLELEGHVFAVTSLFELCNVWTIIASSVTCDPTSDFASQYSVVSTNLHSAWDSVLLQLSCWSDSCFTSWSGLQLLICFWSVRERSELGPELSSWLCVSSCSSGNGGKKKKDKKKL